MFVSFDFLAFHYVHSSHRVTVDLGNVVIPEFPSSLILPLFMVTTTGCILLYKKRNFRKK